MEQYLVSLDFSLSATSWSRSIRALFNELLQVTENSVIGYCPALVSFMKWWFAWWGILSYFLENSRCIVKRGFVSWYANSQSAIYGADAILLTWRK